MRVVSQSGMDFPYEQIMVNTDENVVQCWVCSDPYGKYFCLGIYASSESAKNAVLGMQNAYSSNQMLFAFPSDEEKNV